LQHIQGIDLGRLVMHSGPQPADTVVNWLRQLVPALQYLHQQAPPIVHRDVTPDNLLLKPDGTLMLIDFGAAKEIVGNFTGTIIGKHAYIAPEQFKGKPTPKSDVYSLGSTAYFLLTGKSPEPLTPSCAKEQLDSVPQDLSDLVLKCTALDERQRPDCGTIVNLLCPKEPIAGQSICAAT
jgi:serine/threonine-protein kinase